MPEARSLFDGLGLRGAGQVAPRRHPPSAVVVESEVDQSPEIEGSDPQQEAEAVLLDTAESDPPVIVGHQP